MRVVTVLIHFVLLDERLVSLRMLAASLSLNTKTNRRLFFQSVIFHLTVHSVLMIWQFTIETKSISLRIPPPRVPLAPARLPPRAGSNGVQIPHKHSTGWAGIKKITQYVRKKFVLVKCENISFWNAVPLARKRYFRLR